MEIVIIAIVFIFVGLIGGVIGFVVMNKNQKALKNAPEVKISAVVQSTRSDIKNMNQNFTSSTVNQSGGFEQKTYFVDFKVQGGKKLTFKMKKKEWLSYHEGDEGVLIYKGNKIISFEHKKQTQFKENYFDHKPKKGPIVQFYGESKKLDVNIHSTHRISCDLTDLKLFIKDLRDDTSDWFFVLSKNTKEELQVEKESESILKLSYTKSTHISEKHIEESKLYAEVESFINSVKT
jgi:uncharacterized protein YneF (UPF0154 family)